MKDHLHDIKNVYLAIQQIIWIFALSSLIKRKDLEECIIQTGKTMHAPF